MKRAIDMSSKKYAISEEKYPEIYKYYNDTSLHFRVGSHGEGVSLPLPREVKATSDNTILVDTDRTAITSARGEIKFIGTDGVGPCTQLCIYNRDTNTAILRHTYLLNVKSFDEMVQMIRGDNESQHLEIHILGAQGIDVEDELNDMDRDAMEGILLRIGEMKNASVKSFNVGAQERPWGVLIGAEKGELAAVSEMIKPENLGVSDAESGFGLGEAYEDDAFELDWHDDADLYDLERDGWGDDHLMGVIYDEEAEKSYVSNIDTVSANFDGRTKQEQRLTKGGSIGDKDGDLTV